MKIPHDQYLNHLVTLSAGMLATGEYNTSKSHEHELLAFRARQILNTLITSVPDAGPRLSTVYESPEAQAQRLADHFRKLPSHFPFPVP